MNNKSISKASKIIRNGGLVVFPTETVYGIGADATNQTAVEKIYKAKNRPKANPIIVHVANQKMLSNIVSQINPIEQLLINKFWPGPLTIIFQRHKHMPDSVSAGQETVAVRMPSNKTALELIRKSNKTIAAPSANISGKPSPTHHNQISDEIRSRVGAVIEGGQCKHGVESTVVRVIDDEIVILRPGAITKEQIEKTLPNVEVSFTKKHTDKKKIESPGTAFKHYSPETPLTLIEKKDFVKHIKKLVDENPHKQFAIIATDELLQSFSDESNIKKIPLGSEENLEEVAAHLFSALHTVDTLHVEEGFIQTFPKKGIGITIMDKIERATAQ